MLLKYILLMPHLKAQKANKKKKKVSIVWRFILQNILDLPGRENSNIWLCWGRATNVRDVYMLLMSISQRRGLEKKASN